MFRWLFCSISQWETLMKGMTPLHQALRNEDISAALIKLAKPTWKAEEADDIRVKNRRLRPAALASTVSVFILGIVAIAVGHNTGDYTWGWLLIPGVTAIILTFVSYLRNGIPLDDDKKLIETAIEVGTYIQRKLGLYDEDGLQTGPKELLQDGLYNLLKHERMRGVDSASTRSRLRFDEMVLKSRVLGLLKTSEVRPFYRKAEEDLDKDGIPRVPPIADSSMQITPPAVSA